jgi:hypothetical protein
MKTFFKNIFHFRRNLWKSSPVYFLEILRQLFTIFSEQSQNLLNGLRNEKTARLSNNLCETITRWPNALN